MGRQVCAIDMKIAQAKYEVYIEHAAKRAVGSVMTVWIWRKVNETGVVIEQGSHHGSLEACFASVRRHREAFGDAPITINLRPENAADAPKVIPSASSASGISSAAHRLTKVYESDGLRPRPSQALR